MKKLFAFVLSFFLPIAAFASAQVIVLGVSDAGSYQIAYNYLCWVTPPNPLPNPNVVSLWKAIGPSAGPSTAQITALQNGTVVEYQLPAVTVSTSTAISSVQNEMWSNCNTKQQYVGTLPGQGIFYGFTTINGSTWNQQ